MGNAIKALKLYCSKIDPAGGLLYTVLWGDGVGACSNFAVSWSLALNMGVTPGSILHGYVPTSSI